MTILVIRHALSQANNRASLAFASSEAHLMEEGRKQSIQLGLILNQEYNIDTELTPVAVSEFNRTRETAIGAGLLRLVEYPILNEVKHGMDLVDLRSSLDNGVLPQEAIRIAELILANPPKEQIWVTHGLVIAGLCAVLGITLGDKLIPRFCEIRELPIDLHTK